MTSPSPSRRVLAALAAVGLGALALVACTGQEAADDGATTTTTVADPGLQFVAYSNPDQVITVELGRRFAIMLPADPAHGWRWVVEPVDTRYLAPLGSEFRDDPTLLAQSTTTTTTAPPDDATATTVATSGLSTSSTATSTTAEDGTTTTTTPGPLVQIVSYAGRADGATTVTLRYERVGTATEDEGSTQTVVFNVVVGTVALPPPPPEGN